MTKALHRVSILYGGAIAALSWPLALAVVLTTGLSPQGNLLRAMTVGIAIVIAGTGMGLALVWVGWQSLRERPSSSIHPGPIWPWVVLFAAMLGGGELIRGTFLAPALLPPLHVVASLLPSLIIVIAALGRPRTGERSLTLRDLVRHFSYGAVVATLIASIIEAGVLVSAGVIGGIVVSLRPDGTAVLRRLSAALRWATATGQPHELISLLSSPLIILALGLLVALLTPAIEEVVKSLGVLLTGVARRHLTREQSFALGVTAGAGFGFMETLFNGAVLLPNAWAGPVLLRAGTALVHGLATGLMALAWQASFRRQRHQVFGYALGGVGLHGVWNAASGMAILAGVERFFGGTSAGMPALSGVAIPTIALLAVILGLAAVVFAWLSHSVAMSRPVLTGRDADGGG